MIVKERIGNELYIYILYEGMKRLLYKRWIDKEYGVVMCKISFSAKDVENIKK